MSEATQTQIGSVANNVDVVDVGGERVIDFDIDANTDYEIQSCVMVNDADQVVEAAVRFGRVEERPEIMVEKPILYSAWMTAVSQQGMDSDAVEADLSDFEHLVPHLRVCREDIEEYGCDAVDVDEFAAAVGALAGFVTDVLRADDETLDAEIDAYL